MQPLHPHPLNGKAYSSTLCLWPISGQLFVHISLSNLDCAIYDYTDAKKIQAAYLVQPHYAWWSHMIFLAHLKSLQHVFRHHRCHLTFFFTVNSLWEILISRDAGRLTCPTDI